MVEQLRALRGFELPTSEEIAFHVPTYAGDNPHVSRMRDYLIKYLANDLYGAYIHGSLGSYEEVPYSDFDGLVILKKEVFRSPLRLERVAGYLNLARANMLAQDPLQHHGWFVLTEFDLHCYCEAYFPTALFCHAKSLLHGQGIKLKIQLRDSQEEMCQAFWTHSSSLIRRIKSKQQPQSLYELKSLLSQFMLLPALYVQVRDGRGVWKADSFDLAKRDFEPKEWISMEDVSRIRHNWRYELSDLRRWLLTRPALRVRRCLKRISPAIPQQIQRSLNRELYSGMAHLTRRMQQNLSGRENALTDLSQ